MIFYNNDYRLVYKPIAGTNIGVIRINFRCLTVIKQDIRIAGIYEPHVFTVCINPFGFVFRKQHVIVARKHMNGNNDLPILCKVYYGMTEAEEALLFAMQTGYSAALTPSAKLRANLHGEDKASGEFYEATEDAGFHVGFERGGGVGRIICINTAFAEFKRVGAEIYKEALTLLLEAWGGDPDSLRAEIIQGIVHFVELYHGEYDRERLIYSLRAYEPKFIYAAGKAEKELRGVKRYVNIFYRIYNGRRKHDVLPMKF